MSGQSRAFYGPDLGEGVRAFSSFFNEYRASGSFPGRICFLLDVLGLETI